MDRQRPQQRELVFCHACEEEWYKDERGLQCPSCQSEFTEVIEADHDPRAPAPDPDEGDIEFLNNSSSNPPNQAPADLGNIFQTFGSLFGGAMGGAGPGFPRNQPQMQPQAPERSRSVPPDRQTSGPSPGQPRVQIWTNSGPGFSFTARTSTYDYGGGSGARGNMHDDPNEAANGVDLGRMLVDLIGTIQGHGQFQGGVGADGFPPGFPGGPGRMGTRGPGAMGDIMNHLLGMHGNPGDYITNQDAFDRMMSQLMEQNGAGSAPGPASEDAIRHLSKKAADSKILGGDKADCSICMLETNIGDEVTVLPCGHWYHPDCISMWLREHDTCAICRKGITPKDGDASTVRNPEEEPLHNHDPALLARRQSSRDDNPVWVPESPSRDRRSRPNMRRNSSGSQMNSSLGGQDTSGRGPHVSNNDDSPAGGGFTRTIRNMFSGSSGMSGGGSGNRPPRRS